MLARFLVKYFHDWAVKTARQIMNEDIIRDLIGSEERI